MSQSGDFDFRQDRHERASAELETVHIVATRVVNRVPPTFSFTVSAPRPDSVHRTAAIADDETQLRILSLAGAATEPA